MGSPYLLRRITQITSPATTHTMGSTMVNSSPSTMIMLLGTVRLAALRLLPLMTAVVCSPSNQLTMLPSSWALPPDTLWLMVPCKSWGS